MKAPLHQGQITACTFAGGALVATGSVEGRIRLWDWENAQPSGAFDAHTGPVRALAWDAARERIVSAGHDGLILVHDRNGVRRLVLSGHRGGVHSLAISAGGARLASGGYDRTIRIWRLADGGPVAVLEGHEGAVTALAFLADGRLASGARDDTVRIWDVAAGRQTALGRGHLRWVTNICVVGDSVISASEDGTVRGWDSNSGAERWRHVPEPLTPIWGLARSGDGRAIALGRGGRTELCALAESGIAATRILTAATARAIAASGDRFALGTDNNGVMMFDRDRERGRIETGARDALTLAAGRDPESGGFRAVIGRADGRVELDDGQTRRELSPPHARFTYASALIKPGLFATGAFDGMVRLWRAADGAAAGALAHGRFIFSLSANGDGSRLVAAGGGALSMWDTAAGRELWRVQAPELGFHVWAAMAPDGGAVTAIGENRVLKRFALSADGTQGQAEVPVQLDARLFTGLRLLPEPGAAVAATADGELRRIDLRSGASILLHGANESHVRDFHLSPDARHVVSVSEHGVAAVYDLAAQRLVTPAQMVRCAVSGAAFAPTGELVFIDGLDDLHSSRLTS